MNRLSDIADRNVRAFTAFRVFFNARFYYPVFAVIYLEFGMTLEQFAILNSIWAATIVLAEVPSGALADLVGRRRLVVFAGVMMVAEMLVWSLAPTSDLMLLFHLLAFNRVLSGLAEAAASGADEALAYDSLDAAGRAGEWPHVLQSVSRWQSTAFVFALIIGGLVYDAGIMRALTSLVGLNWELDQQTTMRWPIYLNLLTALVVLASTLQMRECEHPDRPGGQSSRGIASAFGQVWDVARWIARTPLALMIILVAAFLDSVMRMLVTMNSEYFRLLGYPAAAFGVIGACTAVVNFYAVGMARRLVELKEAGTCYLIAGAVAFTSILGIRFFVPYVGVVFTWLLFVGLMMTGFMTSHYLNKIASAKHRATLLSFKGLALNLAYGGIGMLYALLVNRLRQNPHLAENSDQLFKQAANWFPVWFVAGTAVLLLLQAQIRAPFRRAVTDSSKPRES
jgi:MFS family permease